MEDTIDARLQRLERMQQYDLGRGRRVLEELLRQASRYMEHGTVEETVARHMELERAMRDARLYLAESD